MILARHAEALLWVGRYLERAENTSRCLDYAVNSIIHQRPDEARTEMSQLVKTLGLEDELAVVGSLDNRPQMVAFLLSDIDNPGSVVSAITAVRENLRSVRDRIPIELWEEANWLYLRFPFLGHSQSAPSELHELLLMVRRACLAISGVLNEGMRRDEGHAFIDIGRTLERSIFTVGLLKSNCTDPRGAIDPTRMLRLTSSLQAYHRQHGHDPDPDGVVRYLLNAPDLPRSVLSCLHRAEDRLAGLGSGASDMMAPRRKAGLLRARLELGDVDAAMERDPVETLTQLGNDLADLASDVLSAVAPAAAAPGLRAQYVRPGAGVTGFGFGEATGCGPGFGEAAGRAAGSCEASGGGRSEL